MQLQTAPIALCLASGDLVAVHVLPPLPRHGLKRVSGGQLLPGMLLEAVGYRVDPLRQQSPRLVPIDAGLGKADIGVAPSAITRSLGFPLSLTPSQQRKCQ